MIKIFGPPGTGKTSFLMEKVTQHAVDPERIAFVAFTRKAAREAQDRAEQEMPWFRTLHSLAFRCLGLRRTDVVGRKDLQEMGELLNMSVDGAVDPLTGMPMGNGLGDKCLRIIHLARNRMVSLKEEWERSGEGTTWAELTAFSKAYDALRKDLWDFTDMLERFDCPPELDVLMVDEAQDLTPLQWQVVAKLGAGVSHVYVAGDDDQAIYSWAGADVDKLIDLPGEQAVLRLSHRCPYRVFEEAGRISRRISRRVKKPWLPRSSRNQGEIQHVFDVDELEPDEGTWYLLARNRYLLKIYTSMLRRKGYLYTTHRGPGIDPDALKAVLAWETLRSGKRVSREAVELVRSFMTRCGRDPLDADDYSIEEIPELPTRDPWYRALDRFGKEEVEYLRACLRRGEKITRPRIHVDTIHGVKGGEADHVVILQDVSRASYDHFTEYPDDELRCFYVAVTRARETVTWVAPRTNLNVQLMLGALY